MARGWRSSSALVASGIVASVVALTAAVSGDRAAADGTAPDEEWRPSMQVTLGGKGGDRSYGHGFVDILAPGLFWGDGVVFVNPRFSLNDESEQELNVGLGFRQWVPGATLIVGANAYYDTRWTAFGKRFDQLGLGAEILTPFVDLRGNYYEAEGGRKSIASFETVETFTDTRVERVASVLRTTRTTTTRRSVFQQFAAAMDGWDLELGVTLPFPEVFPETRVLGGYVSYDDPFRSKNLEGWMGRLEIRAAPGLILDASLFESGSVERLRGSRYLIGGRVRIPVDLYGLYRGESPVEPLLEAFRVGRPQPFHLRLIDMVIRDIKIQTTISDPILTSVTEETVEEVEEERIRRRRAPTPQPTPTPIPGAPQPTPTPTQPPTPTPTETEPEPTPTPIPIPNGCQDFASCSNDDDCGIGECVQSEISGCVCPGTCDAFDCQSCDESFTIGCFFCCFVP